MSTGSESRSPTVSTDVDGTVGPRAFRATALVGVAVLLAAVVFVLFENVTRVVGGSRSLFALVGTAVVAATVLARTIQPRSATAIAATGAAVGFGYYLEAAGIGVGGALPALDQFVSDTVALVTGLSLERMVAAGIWTLGFAPGPVFLSWYLAVRRRYALAVLPAGAALTFLVLTGDATLGATVVGTVGAVAAVGFGELERRDGSIAQADLLAITFALTVALSLSVTLVPGGAAQPTFLVQDEGDGTLSGSIDTAPDRSAIAGEVDLSPEVRFTVRAEEPSYWRTGVYDRFTGDAWVRTGRTSSYDDASLAEPPGEYETVRQTITVEEGMATMPTAPQPVAVEGDVVDATEVTAHGQVRPDSPLIEGDAYNVESAVVDADPDDLRAAGTDYPDAVTDYYLQTPESTSNAFAAGVDEIVAEDATPYEKAATIESYLRSSKGYSLDVDRPDDNVAETFLFEMEEGYCVYFATTMVQMLRAEDVPARYVTGYTTGQQIDDGEWVVRGLDAHAWVEVYFPDHGWVAFDPTPGDARDAVHGERLAEARENGEEGVDTDESEDVPLPNESRDPQDGNDDNDTDSNDSNDTDPNTTVPNDTPTNPNGSDPSSIPGRDQLDPGNSDGTNGSDAGASDPGDDETAPRPADVVFALAVLVGLAAGAHRAGATDLAGRTARLYWHGRRSDPDADAERAYRRLELLLERRYRPRRRAESVRQYVDRLSSHASFDGRARRVARLYELARYGDGVEREEADEAIGLVDALARERAPVIGRLWRRPPKKDRWTQRGSR